MTDLEREDFLLKQMLTELWWNNGDTVHCLYSPPRVHDELQGEAQPCVLTIASDGTDGNAYFMLHRISTWLMSGGLDTGGRRIVGWDEQPLL